MGSQVMEVVVWVFSIVIVSTFLGMIFQILRGVFDGYMDRWEEKYLVNKKAEYLEENILSVNDPLPGEEEIDDDWDDDDEFEPNDELRRAAERYKEEPFYDDNYDDSGWTDGTADQPADSTPPFDVSIDREAAQGWYDIADKIAEESAKLPDEARGFAPPELDEDQILEEEFGHLAEEDAIDRMMGYDPEVEAFLEAQDEPGPWPEEDDKIHTVGGLTNDKESGFMDFQKKMDENDAIGIQDPYDIIERDARKIDVIDPEEVSNKIEVENTQGDVTIVDDSDKTETEADRIGTFPNENNPFSVAAQVKSIVEKVETPHLPTEEATTQATTLPTTTQAPTTQATTTLAPPPSYDSFKKREAVDEDELFDAALRAKAEQDKQDFLRRNG